MKIMSDDGRVFSTEVECKAYEAKLKDLAETERRNEAEKKRKYEEIQEQNAELGRMINAFEKEYGLKISFYDAIDPLDYIICKFGDRAAQ
jgi:hypothetical protein